MLTLRRGFTPNAHLECSGSEQLRVIKWPVRFISVHRLSFLIQRTFLAFLLLLSYYVSLRSQFRVTMSGTISSLRQSLYPQLFVGGFMSYCVFVYVCVQWCPTFCCFSSFQLSVLCCVLLFFVFVFFPCLVDTMVPISLDCPLLIAPSVFVYFCIFISHLELKQNGATIFQCVHKPSIYSITAFVYLRHMASQMHIINKINIYSSTNLYQYRDIFPSRTFNTILTFKLHNEFRGTRNIVIPQKLSLVGWSPLWCLTPL